ncbi:hypothetical protein MLD38_025163 [Melastoma candidum]|uniref:Uncharacterized protein n=1 Tax=Melastoma candidum TaxID=119954 RepID=A0ACB9NUY7_9MYRT|nr:hypothetical protein MLD38_025163 [Melastoma candidum]
MAGNHRLNPISLSLIVIFLLLTTATADEHEEVFTEELLLKPLPDRKVLSHFLFLSTSTAPAESNHRHLFPKSISQLVQKFHVIDMELSFTQGRWNYENWGGYEPLSSRNAKPPGVELWAIFDVPQEDVDSSWRGLTHSLSGLFCASINYLEHSTAYSTPEWGFQPSSGSLRYGTLPREAVCTENLTPWLKLLPCRDKAGISVLMDRPSIYRGFYHSQRLRLRVDKSGSSGTGSVIRLEQTLTVVLQPSYQRASFDPRIAGLQPSWSMSSLFGRKISGACVLARTSNVYLHLEKNLIATLKGMQQENFQAEVESSTLQNSFGSSVFELSDHPDEIIKEVNDSQDDDLSHMYKFSLGRLTVSGPFDLGIRWKKPVLWSCPKLPLRVSRFLMGSGNERGAIAITLTSPYKNEEFTLASGVLEACPLTINVFQVVPWYIKVYYHSLRLAVDGELQPTEDAFDKLRVLPSEDKVSPGVLELVLKLPCGFKSAALTVEFDKGFLHIDEYPPDANQGFDIPSAVITFPKFHPSMQFDIQRPDSNSSLFTGFEERVPVRAYTEVLLVPLTTPDFSMPYNVITITCTVFALYFGSLLNVLRRRAGEEERLLQSKGKKLSPLAQLVSKLTAKIRGRPLASSQSRASSSPFFINKKLVLKVVVVAGIAVAWQLFSN